MIVELSCPWCDAAIGMDLPDLALPALTCPDCSTTVDLGDGSEAPALPLAA